MYTQNILHIEYIIHHIYIYIHMYMNTDFSHVYTMITPAETQPVAAGQSHDAV